MYCIVPESCTSLFSCLLAVTFCDDIEIAKVFDEGFNFKVNYSVGAVDRNSYQLSAVRVVPRAAYRTAQAQRTIQESVLSPEGCVMACLTEKDFICRDCDYFIGNSGKCALYNTTGYVFQENPDPNNFSPFYVGDNSASNHYIIYKRGEDPTPCTAPRKPFIYLNNLSRYRVLLALY